MESVRASWEIAARPEEVWALVGAFNDLPRITDAYVKSELEGKGRFRRLSDGQGGELFEELEHYDEAARSFGYRILETKGVSLPYRAGTFRATLTVLDGRQESGSVLEVVASYEPVAGAAEIAARETRAFYQGCVEGIRKILAV